MFSRLSFVVFYVTLFILISLPTRSTASVYSWQDVDGVITFTDDLSNAPSNIRIKVISEETRPQTVSTGSIEPASAPAPKQPSRVATEGEFVVELVEELGLSDNPSEEEAAGILTDILVAPRLGQWELDRPMSEDLTVRLRKLAVAAAESGRITLTPDEVLLAFDTTAALLGLTIPVAATPDEAAESPYPLAETPPLVYVTSPPIDIYPYYTWVPVTGGFWWNGFLCSGFFVLDANRFHSGHRGFQGHHGTWDSGHIGRQFRNHIADRHFVKNPAFSNTGRVLRSPAHSGRTPIFNRPSTHSIRSNDGMRSSVPRFSGAPLDRRHFPQRPMPQSSLSRPFNRTSTARPAQQNSPVRYVTRPAPSRSFSSGTGGFRAPVSQGFAGMGGAGIGMNRGGSGFSAGPGSFRGR